MSKEKIRDCFLRFIQFLVPKTDLEKQLDEINKLKNNPDNYGKVAAMYLKLHNMYALLIGKGYDDEWNFSLSQFYKKQYEMYREMYYENNSNKDL